MMTNKTATVRQNPRNQTLTDIWHVLDMTRLSYQWNLEWTKQILDGKTHLIIQAHFLVMCWELHIILLIDYVRIWTFFSFRLFESIHVSFSTIIYKTGIASHCLQIFSAERFQIWSIANINGIYRNKNIISFRTTVFIKIMLLKGYFIQFYNVDCGAYIYIWYAYVYIS